MLIEHAGGVRGFWRVILWRLGAVRRGQALAVRLWRVRVQGGQQALASLLVQGQVVGALGEVVLHLLVALSEFFHQRCSAVEVGNHFTLIIIKTFLDVVQLTLRTARRGVRQQTGNQKTNSDTGNQGESRQQPNQERLYTAMHSQICQTESIS